MKRNRFFIITVIILFALFSVFFSGCSNNNSGDSEENSYSHVDLEEAKKLIDTDGSVLVDVRNEIIFSFEHIPGAICIPYDTVSDDPDEIVPDLPDKNQIIILYCDYGAISKEVAEKLVAKGYTNVYEFDGLLVWDGEIVGKAQ
ncbi:MAG TPA: rhodanese-like domain-containing protein [Mogibacterium sp.]|nr:rhodanese-like domain-containing protein [Mogibacterium sp.]